MSETLGSSMLALWPGDLRQASNTSASDFWPAATFSAAMEARKPPAAMRLGEAAFAGERMAHLVHGSHALGVLGSEFHQGRVELQRLETMIDPVLRDQAGRCLCIHGAGLCGLRTLQHAAERAGNAAGTGGEQKRQQGR